MRTTKQEQAKYRAQRKIAKLVKERFPDTYTVPGLGFCGPGYQEAEAFKAELEASDKYRDALAATLT